MRPYPAVLFLSSGLLLCLGWGWAWGDSDKTIVDLERGPASLAIRYSRPRGAQLYHYDKTELDVATPITDQANDTPRTDPSQSAVPDTTPAAEPRALFTPPSSSNR